MTYSLKFLKLLIMIVSMIYMTGSQNGITGNCVELAEHNLNMN